MKAKQTGFTLIELMFTIVVLAVLLGIGVPNFRDFVRNSRMTAAANDLLADFNLARSEAIKRRAPVTLCKSGDGESCDNSTAEFLSWIVFVDDADPRVDAAEDGNGIVDNEDELILRRTSVGKNIEVAADGNLMVFNASGFARPGIDDTVSQFVLCDSRGNNLSVGGLAAARGVTVSAMGRATTTRDKVRIAALGGCP